MLVTLLLAAGLLAMKGEEGVFARLICTGSVSRTSLLTQKIVLAAAAAFVVTLIQLAVIRIFVGLEE